MSKISIEKVKLLNFLKLICLEGQIINKEALFDVQKEGIGSLIVSSDKTLAIRATLNAELETVGQVGVTSLTDFIKYLQALDETIKMEFSKNRLILSSKTTKISVVLQNADYIVNKIDNDKFDKVSKSVSSGVTLKLNKEIVDSITDRFGIVASDDLVLEAKKGKLYLHVKNSETETELFSDVGDLGEVKSTDFKIKVSKYLVNILNVINDEVIISLAKDNPNAIGITATNEDYTVEYLLALKVEEETTSEEPEAEVSKEEKGKKEKPAKVGKE